MGVALIAAVALGAFIQARYFDSPKLCIEAMVQMMAKEKKDVSPGMFIRETAGLLDVGDATGEKQKSPSGGDRLVGLSRLRCNSPYGCP